MKPDLFGEKDKSRLAWEALELPAPAPAPPGFAAAVAAKARAERSLLPGFALSPAWAGLAAVLLVATGVFGGAGLGVDPLAPDDSASFESSLDDPSFWTDEGLLDGSLFDPAAESGLTESSESGAEVYP